MVRFLLLLGIAFAILAWRLSRKQQYVEAALLQEPWGDV